MAEEKKEKKEKKGKGMATNGDAIEELVKIILIVMIISSVFGRVGEYLSSLQSKASSAFSFGSSPVGVSVTLVRGTSVFDAPGGKLIGEQLAGALGKVTKGPLWKNNSRWWYVDFASGIDGWVAEGALKNSDGSVFQAGDTPIGSKISTAGQVRVLDGPGGALRGTQQANAVGTVIEGPVYRDGQRFWNIDFETGPDGWVAEKSLLSEDGSVFDAGDTPVGSEVATKKEITVLVSPGGGESGTQPAGALGTITKGPEFKDGKRYWYVDFESGPDGWVEESALGKAPAFDAGTTPVGTHVAIGGNQVIGSSVAMSISQIVYDAPAGSPVGLQKAGSKGVIVKGPETVSGIRYWYVDFESGPDGWVPETALNNKNGSAFSPQVTAVLDVPGGKLIGEQAGGALGTITKGPEFKDGKRYWYVDFESGPDGWVEEGALVNDDGSAFSAGKTPIGTQVLSAHNMVVLDAPGGDIIGGQPEGVVGIVTKGPEFKDGKRYWYVDFESGPDGWVEEGDMLASDGTAFDPGDTPVGKQMSTKRVSSVYGENGKQIGTQKKGATGIIAGGPVVRDGIRYWYVDFESGPDGWVAEGDIAPYKQVSAGARMRQAFFRLIKILAIILSIILIIAITVVLIRTNRVTAEMSAGIEPKRGEGIVAPRKNEAWERIITLSESVNPSDWKLAIIEADIILDRMLRGMGYVGETIGDRLKAVEQSDFTTIDSAWEAHKVRNRVAHEGADFLITQRETRRVIALYKQVFDEFRLI